jgi:hypothetical protein
MTRSTTCPSVEAAKDGIVKFGEFLVSAFSLQPAVGFTGSGFGGGAGYRSASRKSCLNTGTAAIAGLCTGHITTCMMSEVQSNATFSTAFKRAHHYGGQPSCVLPCCNLPAGELLGAGSFGRVYKGRWNNMDVAVKVIEHDATSALEVENEVLLMMGLQHECIVAAYHYVTYARSSEARAVAAEDYTSGSCDGNTPSRDSGHRLTSSGGHKSSNSGQTSRRESAGKKQKAESHLVMEFCDCGTLATAVASLRQQQQQQEAEEEEQAVVCEVLPFALQLLHDVARGLQAIHSKNVVHGDLVSRYVHYLCLLPACCPMRCSYHMCCVFLCTMQLSSGLLANTAACLGPWTATECPQRAGSLQPIFCCRADCQAC